MMDSDSSETNLVIITRRDRFKLFYKLYWRSIIILLVPIILSPIIFIKYNNAYIGFYVFLLMIVYLSADVLHPAVIAIASIPISSVLGGIDRSFIREMYISNDLLDCIGVMMLIIAIEYSNIHKRIALKVLLIVGCSHYRLSFLLFFTTMFLSMWISNVLACGFMMPLVKAILAELEKFFLDLHLFFNIQFTIFIGFLNVVSSNQMGILEIYQIIGKAQQISIRHEDRVPRPSEFTIFYFLGIAYSSSIGDMATLMGTQTNQIFKIYCETIFPAAPKIEFPHFMLLNLPGVLIMETLLYIWMNFYFLGMFRNQNEIALQMTEEEAQYIDTLLATQYHQLGQIKFHEFAVATVVMLTLVLQPIVSTVRIDHQGDAGYHDQIYVSSPCLMGVILLFIMPVNLDFLKFFKWGSESSDPLPRTQSKSCLNWALLNSEMNWSVPIILAGSSTLFESLRDSGMTDEFEAFFLHFANLPLTATIFVTVFFCKILTEFASSSVVVYGLLPSVAKMSIVCDINPHYMMLAVTLGSCLSFHLVTGAAVNAMVCSYAHIPPWRMMSAGLGPSVIAVVVVWFTVAIWSTAIWTDINLYPQWADINIFKMINKHT